MIPHAAVVPRRQLDRPARAATASAGLQTMNVHLLGSRAQRSRLEANVLAGRAYQVMPLFARTAYADQAGDPCEMFEVLTLTLEYSQALAWIAQVRQLDADLGIVATQAGAAGEPVWHAYEAGADACFSQELQPDELQALMKALARRLFVVGRAFLNQVLHFDARALLLVGPSGNQALTVSEARVLSVFVSAPERSVSYEQLLASTGGKAPHGSGLSVMISRLRQKLRRAGAGERCITSLRGWGYQLCVVLHTA